MSTASLLMDKWTRYRDTRRGTYEYRSQTRYRAVLLRLIAMGLRPGDHIIDVGAGSCQFGQFLIEQGWRIDYTPVDAVLDGTDLETWKCPRADFVVCIEVVEHLKRPERLMRSMIDAARRGVVITTPNCEAVDVIACDPTHVSVVPPWVLEMMELTTERHSWFGILNDSLLAWRRHVTA